MNNVKDLIAALRGTPSRSKRLLHQAAADTIEALLADLVRTEHCELCDLCVHGHGAALCLDTDFICDDCPYDCRCKGCRDSSKWEWRGIKEETT